MKKNYFFLLALLMLLSGNSFCQISLGTADLLSGPDTIRMIQASSSGISDTVQTGPSFSWDYSTLVPVLQYVDTFVAVTSTPFLYQLYFNDGFIFPNSLANFGIKEPNITVLTTVQMTDIYDFYQNNSKMYSTVGFGSTINGIPLSTRYDTNDVVYRFPLKYGNRDSSYSSFIDTLPTIGYYGQQQKRVNHVDGWGTLKTPVGTYSVLKITSVVTITDTLYSDKYGFGIKVPRPAEYEYKWLAKGQLVPVLEIDESASVITSITYKDSVRSLSGIHEISDFQAISVYPNPASEQFNYVFSLAYPAVVKLELFDVYGQSLRQLVNAYQGAGFYSCQVSKSELGICSGIYFARLTVNNLSSVRKIVIQ